MTTTMVNQEKEIRLPNHDIFDYLVDRINNTPNWRENTNDNFAIELVESALKAKTAYDVMNEYNVKFKHVRTALLKALNINPKFGDRVIELNKAIYETPDWEQYVSKKTKEVVNYVFESQSTDDTMAHFQMKYTTVRSHILRALDRITEKRTDFKRYGKSEQAQELFDLISSTHDWKDYVTDNEIFLAEQFREVRNFYELGRILGLAPSNIAGTLYGTTQKIGVIGKIKQKLLQSDRRDIDKRKDESAE